MPNYVYRCSDGHVFERRAGFDDKEFPCPIGVGIPDFPGDRKAVTLHACSLPAKRDEVYRDQGVIFKGSGWAGKSSIASPPESPSPPSSEGESPDTHFEKLDEFAHENYDHDRNVRPYVKEEAERRRRDDPPAGS